MRSIRIFLYVLLAVCVEVPNAAILPRRPLSDFKSKIQRALQKSPQQHDVKRIGRVFYPIGYGADPTGKQESGAAILSAIKDAFAVHSGLELTTMINDLGGVVVDLQGGNYMISKPISLPPGGGNVVIHSGTLRASADFPADRYLIEMSSSPPEKESDQQTFSLAEKFGEMKQAKDRMYYEDITLRDLVFDSNFRGGGLYIAFSVRNRVDACMFIHFSTTGILIKKGHETFILNTFLGQIPTNGGDIRERNYTGTAIDLNSHDNVLTDISIFSAATGVVIRGPANIVTGLHCYNKATYFGGIGVLVKGLGALTRIDNCYMDYNGIVLEDPIHVHITNGFFLGNGDVVLRSVKGKISGLNVVDCMFWGKGGAGLPIVKLDESKRPFTRIENVAIDRNNVERMTHKSTMAKKIVTGNGTRWVADFSKQLVFPNRISHFQYSFYVKGPEKFVEAAVTAVVNNSVVVETKKVVDGVVSVLVNQNGLQGEGSIFV